MQAPYRPEGCILRTAKSETGEPTQPRVDTPVSPTTLAEIFAHYPDLRDAVAKAAIELDEFKKKKQKEIEERERLQQPTTGHPPPNG